jgi:ABC-type transport system substrate-binding protein
VSTAPQLEARAALAPHRGGVLRGDLDCACALPTSLIERVEANADLVVGTAEEAAGYYLAVNFERHDLGFGDLRVRRALSHAIDRQTRVDRVFDGHAAPGYGPAGPACVLYHSYHDVWIDGSDS